jgi:hypothetical protein
MMVVVEKMNLICGDSSVDDFSEDDSGFERRFIINDI